MNLTKQVLSQVLSDGLVFVLLFIYQLDKPCGQL